MKNHTSNYQPINSYGVIGDCHSVVLVSPDGSVDWGCLPDFDSPALFCRLLDAERGGYFQIAPTDEGIFLVHNVTCAVAMCSRREFSSTMW